MALDFPNSPSDGQVYTDPSTGEQWVYEAATNSWTSKGLVNTSGGLVYKGTVDITAAPPAASSGWQYSVLADGTANAGFGPGITGTVAKGDIIMYTGTGWTDTSNNVPQATAAVAGIDKKLWKRSGTALAPETAADTVQISAGTALLPGLTPVGDPDTGVWAPAADQIAVSTNGIRRVLIENGVIHARPADECNLVLREEATSLVVSAETNAGRNDNRLMKLEGSEFAFIEGGSEKACLDTSGRLGIGVTAPLGILHARPLDECNFVVRNDGSSLVLSAETNSGRDDNRLMRLEGNEFVFIENGSEKARIDSFGRLLLGTSNPVSGSAATFQCANIFNIAGVSVYADNTAAKAGGLVPGDIYRKADGTLMITF